MPFQPSSDLGLRHTFHSYCSFERCHWCLKYFYLYGNTLVVGRSCHNPVPIGKSLDALTHQAQSCLTWAFNLESSHAVKIKTIVPMVWFAFLTVSAVCSFDHFSVGHFLKCKRQLILTSKELSTINTWRTKETWMLCSSLLYPQSKKSFFFCNRSCSNYCIVISEQEK